MTNQQDLYSVVIKRNNLYSFIDDKGQINISGISTSLGVVNPANSVCILDNESLTRKVKRIRELFPGEKLVVFKVRNNSHVLEFRERSKCFGPPQITYNTLH